MTFNPKDRRRKGFLSTAHALTEKHGPFSRQINNPHKPVDHGYRALEAAITKFHHLAAQIEVDNGGDIQLRLTIFIQIMSIDTQQTRSGRKIDEVDSGKPAILHAHDPQFMLQRHSDLHTSVTGQIGGCQSDWILTQRWTDPDLIRLLLTGNARSLQTFIAEGYTNGTKQRINAPIQHAAFRIIRGNRP